MPDGTYDSEEIFFRGTSKTRPEIFVMGSRNPFRISVDKNQAMCIGVMWDGFNGPDSLEDRHRMRSVRPGVGQFQMAYFVGDNKAYNHFNLPPMSPVQHLIRNSQSTIRQTIPDSITYRHKSTHLVSIRRVKEFHRLEREEDVPWQGRILY